mmetsp:Transcript_15739/g.29717  ORF Transcript_15739/g.29717 Transcript_15739/m.29717 type:complete len:117 (-) Transcript_15739:18-368(-)
MANEERRHTEVLVLGINFFSIFCFFDFCVFCVFCMFCVVDIFGFGVVLCFSFPFFFFSSLKPWFHFQKSTKEKQSEKDGNKVLHKYTRKNKIKTKVAKSACVSKGHAWRENENKGW